MEFAFYNDDAKPRGLRAAAIVPFRRALRRLQRPYFVRLKDLLMTLWQANVEREREIQAMQQRLAMMEVAHRDLMQRHRALMMDRGASARRLAHLEDLQAKADSPAETSAPRIWRNAA